MQFFTMLAFALQFAGASGILSSEGADLIGLRAPDLRGIQWLEGGDTSTRGKVLLIRWWTAPGCPFCRESAPFLNRWHKQYAAEGLRVLGLYHHKSSSPLIPGKVRAHARDLGLEFPVGIDPGWRNLKSWWLDGHRRGFTSVSFLVDQEGIIRYVHPGGSYTPEEAAAIESVIRSLLGVNSR